MRSRVSQTLKNIPKRVKIKPTSSLETIPVAGNPTGRRHPETPTLKVGKFLAFLLCVLSFLLLGTNAAQAYSNEVYMTSGTYRWKINDVEIGSTTDLATAISNCIWQGSGVREVHVLVGGTLASTIELQSGLRLYCHSVTFTRSHTGEGFHHEGGGDIQIYDMNLTGGSGMGIHTSRAGNLTFSRISINGGFIGIRIDSHPSRPYEAGRWVYNVNVTDCTFENLGSHGLETYGIDGFTVDNIVAKNCGECGVLINKGYNGTIGFVDAYRCCYGGGYAGLRFANDCYNITANKLNAVECGRGFFTVSTVKNCTLNNAYIRGCTGHSILLQYSDNVVVASGTYDGDGLNHYTSVNCQINAVPLGSRKILNYASGRALDVNGNADGSLLRIQDYTAAANQKWTIGELGSDRYSIRTSQTDGRAVDSSWNPSNGTATYIWSFWNGNPQKWQIQSVGDSRFRLNSQLNLNQCLDSAGTANGSTVLMWSYWGGSNQQWSIGLP